MFDLSVITVTWNSAKLIGEQMLSVRSGREKISCEQIIADNASTDDTVKVVEGIQKDFFSPESNGVKLIKNEKNFGFGGANNQAAKLASGEFFLFLNPDMRVEKLSLDKMVEWMRSHPDVGLAGCKLVDENGKINEDAAPRRLPGILDQAAIILKLHHIFPFVLNRYLYKGFDFNKEQEVDSIRGSFMIMRREIYDRLGWAFDPRYFIWFEDVDLCRETKRLGFKVMHTPIISCVDYVGQSFKQRTTLWKQKQFTKSMLQYFQKWEPAWKCLVISVLKPIGIAMARASEAFNKK
ncbi:MAG: glycosyltransferase family 2 protein [Patescibacteria group bacterium]|nr:glycosyltransferase family 2 protein [Patescibacteria group bacterium]